MQTLLDSQQQPRKPRAAAASLVAAGVIFSLGYALGSMHTGIAAHQMLREVSWRPHPGEASGGEREKAGVAGDGFGNLGGRRQSPPPSPAVSTVLAASLHAHPSHPASPPRRLPSQGLPVPSSQSLRRDTARRTSTP